MMKRRLPFYLKTLCIIAVLTGAQQIRAAGAGLMGILNNPATMNAIRDAADFAVNQVIAPTARAVGRGVDAINKALQAGGGEQEFARQVITKAMSRYDSNIAALQQGRFDLQSINAWEPSNYYGANTVNISGPFKTLPPSLTISAIDHYKNPDNPNDPEFSRDTIRLNSVAHAGQLSVLMGAARQQLSQMLIQSALNKQTPKSVGEMASDVMKAQAEAKAKADADIAKAGIAASQSGENLKQMLNFAQNPRIWAIMIATFGTGVALWHLLPRLIAGKPQIVSEMSFLSPLERLMGKKLPPADLDQIVFPDEVADHIMHIVGHINKVRESGGELMNLIFFGPPGTGKTLTAKALARSSGLDYMLINASAFEQLTPGQAVKELEDTFRLARANKKAVLLFFDEADSVLGKRGSSMETLTSRRVINTLLANVTDTHNAKFMIVLATNLPKSLDAAVLSRFPEEGWILFSKPSETGRMRILKMYLEKFAEKDNLTIPAEVETNMPKYSQLLQGTTGRDLRAIARSIADRALDSDNAEVSDQVITKTIETTLQNRKNLEQYNYNAAEIAS